MGDSELQIFRERLKELRNQLNLTQTEFVKNLGITASALSAYETTNKNPSISVVKRIAEKYHISIDWLCGLSDKKENSFEPTTYSDIIDILSEIDKVIGICIEENQEYKDSHGFRGQNCGIHLPNYQMEKFLQDWAKYLKLRHAGTIDDDIYQACMSKLKRESNIEITKDLPFD